MKKQTDYLDNSSGHLKISPGILFLISSFFFLLFLPACTVQKPNEAPEQQDKLIVVGFSQVGSESDWREGNTKSMLEALSVENGYRLIFDDAQQKQEKQITAIRNFINQGVDYIVLAPTTEKNWETVRFFEPCISFPRMKE